MKRPLGVGVGINVIGAKREMTRGPKITESGRKRTLGPEQRPNKRSREDSADVVPPMMERNPKKKKADFRDFYDFDTDPLKSDDGEDFDDLESESDYGGSLVFEVSYK